MRTADGCHVFAGGFSFGVRERMHVPRQLEIHGLGRETVKSAGIDFIEVNHWEDWPDPSSDAVMLFGNPRCTGFSCTTSGYGEAVHGPWSEPTEDIHQLCHYGVRHEYPLICWESVQQAMTVGRELLDHLRDVIFRPASYRVAHLMINAATFGNAQHRKRYFFMAYKDDRNFNIEAPRCVERHTTVADVICTKELMSREVSYSRFGKKSTFDADTCMQRADFEEQMFRFLPPGFCLNQIAHFSPDVLPQCPEKIQYRWRTRTSDTPYSMHCIKRLNGDDFMPVISGSAGRYIHPILDRTLTLRELSLLMGWPSGITPVGDDPIGQIGKGICPEIGTWLAEQALLYVDDAWGKEDWESSYCDKTGHWVGHDYSNDKIKPPEKMFDLTTYCPAKPERVTRRERFDGHFR